MNSLLKSIESTIQSAIEKYIQDICALHTTIDPKELEKIWNDVADNVQVSVKFKTKISESPKKETLSTSTVVSGDDDNMCQYIIQKGSKEGQKCGTKTKINSTFCSRHVKYEGVEQKTKKVMPQVKKSLKKSVVEKSSPKSSASTSSNKSKCKTSLVLNKDINMHWHSESGMVFKMIDEKNTAVATYKDGEFHPLTEENVELCKKWNFHPYKIFTIKELATICNIKKPIVVEEEKPKVEINVVKKDVSKSKSTSSKVEDKKSLARSISDTKLQAKQVEDILDELQLSSINPELDDDMDEELEEEVDDPTDEDYIEEDE
jgi:hypothetical protein